MRRPSHSTALLATLVCLACSGSSVQPDLGGAGADAHGNASPPDDDAVIESTAFPPSLRCGESFDATVTVRNTGRATWTHDDYKLGGVDDQDPFAITRVYLAPGETVPPGGRHEFHVAMTAPGAAGSYLTDWRMVHELVRWFGATAAATVKVECGGGGGGVDASTLTKKMLLGYQGWFNCPGDGAPVNDWVHWFGAGGRPTFDLWPETAELGADELCPTRYTRPDGSPAPLYSAWNPRTVDRHFRWMEDHGIDGVFLQRFSSELAGRGAFFEQRNRVAENVRAGAEAHGRVFAIEYDISGASAATLVPDIQEDWKYLVDVLRVTESPRYLHHKGKPVLAVWGWGFADRPGTPQQALELLGWLKGNGDPRYEVLLMGGFPREWRTDPALAPWRDVFFNVDVVNPWTVGAYADDAGADVYAQRVRADVADCHGRGQEFMPVIWPGFSWHNLVGGPQNMIPRRGGRFYWRQAFNAAGAGVDSVFGAMFDEVDEGTAMFQLAPTHAELPTQDPFVSLDADGLTLPADWYLRLAGEASRMLRGEYPPTPDIPIHP